VTVKNWETIKFCFCERIGAEVGLEAEFVYPADWLPELKPRILAHRCTRSLECNAEERASCKWAGTNPMVDPFTNSI